MQLKTENTISLSLISMLTSQPHFNEILKFTESGLGKSFKKALVAHNAQPVDQNVLIFPDRLFSFSHLVVFDKVKLHKLKIIQT